MISKNIITLQITKFFVLFLIIAFCRNAFSFEKKILSKYENNSIAMAPESLAMPRTRMAFIDDRMIRLFNGRGATCIRDKSLTGLQSLFFPPIDIRDYRFQLAFREQESNVLIQDIVDTVYAYYSQTGKGPHPLGLNFQDPHAPFVMLLQQANWQPNLYSRKGTFHKKFAGRWISFAIETETRVSARSDEIYLTVQIENREPDPLRFVVIAQQSASELVPKFPCEKSIPPGSVTQPDGFTLSSEHIQIRIQSDLAELGERGWSWEIPGYEKRTARFAIVMRSMEQVCPNPHASDLSQRIEQTTEDKRVRLYWAWERMPQISTSDKQFNDLYYRCVLSVIEARWERENFVVNPFYAIGSWGWTIAWDLSFASEMLAILDPEGLRKAILTYISFGLLTSSNIPWNGKIDKHCYIQKPFAVMRIVQDYLRQTGDVAILDQMVEGASVIDWMKEAGNELVQRFRQRNGLLDFGAGSNPLIEIRTDGYQYIVPAANGLTVNYLQQITRWCRERSDPEFSQFQHWADQIQNSMTAILWNKQEGWFYNLHSDGRREMVWSYHLYDLLDRGVLSVTQEKQLIAHLSEGQFLGPYGMYSISKRDSIHWDFEDVDWGGGGQYVGMPFRIAESVFRLGHYESGWDILSRCVQWANHYPYLPQEIFTDILRSPEVVEMSLEISAASGVQAILFGVFGLRPKMDGSLDIMPAYHARLGNARMTGYRFRGHSYDVVMKPLEYEVYRDGELFQVNKYGEPVRFTPN